MDPRRVDASSAFSCGEVGAVLENYLSIQLGGKEEREQVAVAIERKGRVTSRREEECRAQVRHQGLLGQVHGAIHLGRGHGCCIHASNHGNRHSHDSRYAQGQVALYRWLHRPVFHRSDDSHLRDLEGTNLYRYCCVLGCSRRVCSESVSWHKQKPDNWAICMFLGTMLSSAFSLVDNIVLEACNKNDQMRTDGILCLTGYDYEMHEK